MRSIIQFLLHRQFRTLKHPRTNGGFTLLELLVAVLIASIIVGSLLGFMVDILSSDRREQAKSASEQEIQGALDYIARDLEQAIYIYDAQGLAAITGNNSPTTCTNAPVTGTTPLPAGCSQIPASPEMTPVLVFWKRQFLPSTTDVTLRGQGNTSTSVGCLVTIPGGGSCPSGGIPNKQDYQLYSLVAYYLIRDNNPNWSATTRIGRFEIRDGIRDISAPVRDGIRTEVDPSTGTSSTVSYDLLPSQGFMPFSLAVTGNSLRDKLNRWQKHSEPYNLTANPVSILIDYVDQTEINPTNLANSPPKAENCSAAIRQVDTTTNANAYVPQQVPTYASDRTQTPQLNPVITPIPNQFQTGSFYACVDSERTIAQVFIRGNALARMTPRNQIPQRATFTPNQFAFFPSNQIQVQGRGLVNIQR